MLDMVLRNGFPERGAGGGGGGTTAGDEVETALTLALGFGFVPPALLLESSKEPSRVCGVVGAGGKDRDGSEGPRARVGVPESVGGLEGGGARPDERLCFLWGGDFTVPVVEEEASFEPLGTVAGIEQNDSSSVRHRRTCDHIACMNKRRTLDEDEGLCRVTASLDVEHEAHDGEELACRQDLLPARNTRRLKVS